MFKTLSHLYEKALAIGISETSSFEERKKIRVMNLVFLIGAILPIPSIIVYFFLDIKGLYGIEISYITTPLIGLLLPNKYKFSLGSILLFVLIPLQLMHAPLYIGDIGTEYLFIICIVIGFYILQRKVQLLMFIYLAGLFCISKYLLSITIYPQEYSILETYTYIPNVFIAIVLIALATYLFKHDTLVYQKMIDEQSDDLVNKVEELGTKEVLKTRLLLELNHRTKNNLQFVSSLITLQIYSASREEVINELKATRYKIDAIALLHQHLYEKENPLNPDLLTYLKKLGYYTLQTMSLEESVFLNFNVDKMNCSSELSSHIGLIVSELLLNTLKCCVRKNKAALEVFIDIRKNLNEIVIEIKNNEEGFGSPDHNYLQNSFGLELINTLSRQYNGEFNIINRLRAHSQGTLNIKQSEMYVLDDHTS